MSRASDQARWPLVKFGDMAQNVTDRIDPAEADGDVYVGLEHLDVESLKIRRCGKPADVIGQKLGFRKGDIIFGKRRAYQRKLAVAECDGICSAHAMVVRAKPKVVLPEFLPFLMQSDLFMDRAVEISVGSLSPTINWTTLKVQEFPLPPLGEQRRIADILWAADQAAETWREVVRGVYLLKRALDEAAFRLRATHEAPNTIPATWRIGRVTDLGTIDPRPPKNIDARLKVTFLPMSAIAEGGGIREREVRPYQQVAKGFTFFAEGDVLFAKITPCTENGKGAIANDLSNGLGFGSTEFFVLRPKASEDRQFLYHLTMSEGFRQRAAHWMRGSAGQQRVPRDFFEQRPIAIPPARDRAAFGQMLQVMIQQGEAIRAHLTRSLSLKSSLLQTLLGGHRHV